MNNIFTEVDAALRRDRMASIWNRYGLWIIGTLLLVILGVATVSYYSYWRSQNNEAISQNYDALVETLKDAETAEATKMLDDFIAQNNGGYATLAQFQKARYAAVAGDADVAIEVFSKITETRRLPSALRDFARLQAAQAGLNTLTAADIEARLQPILKADNPYHPLAQETLALALIRGDKKTRAFEILTSLQTNQNATPLTQARARILASALGIERPQPTKDETTQ